MTADRTFVAERPAGVWRSEVELRWALVYLTSSRTATLSHWHGYADREQAVTARAKIAATDPVGDLVLARWPHRVGTLEPVARSLHGEVVTLVVTA